MKNCERCQKEFKDRIRYGGKPKRFCSSTCQGAAWMAKAQKESPEKLRAWRRNFRKVNPISVKSSEIKKSFGITRIEWIEILESQLGICANPSCSEFATVVDHNHATGLIRSMLCTNCNLALGLLKEDSSRISGLESYSRGKY